MKTSNVSLKKSMVLIALTAVCVLSGCASMKPVVYPNKQAKAAGTEKLESDIQACKQKADEYVGPGDRKQHMVRRAGIATAVGAAAGGAWGFVVGGAGDALTRGGAGGAAGGAGSIVKDLLTMNEPDGVHQKFVEKCLKKKGYEVLGWR